MRRVLALGVLLATLGVPAAANAADRADCGKRLEKRYTYRYNEVRKRHGVRAPGRDIRHSGVVKRNQTVRDAHCGEIRKSVRQLKVLLTVPKEAPALVRTARPPAQMPSGVQSAGVEGQYSGGYAIPTEIVMCESGGNGQAVNTSNPARPAGYYQIITSTWLANGGGAYAPTADAASKEAQDIVAARIWNGGAGRGQWEC